MKTQEINIAIAEHIGWIVPYRCRTKTGRPYFGKNPTTGKYEDIPNYCGDLNAIHEAEKALRGDKDDEGFEHSELGGYYEQLCLVCGDKQEPLNVYEIDLVRATASQRAEAFLRTIGKWKEAARQNK